jgi:alpha-maltose-1-phosphate synthase
MVRMLNPKWSLATATLHDRYPRIAAALKSTHTMQVIQVVHGAFHHFDLARELEARGHLQRIYSGFPWRRLQREGVPRNHVATFPWLHTSLFMIEQRWRMPRQLKSFLDYSDTLLLDSWVASQIEACDVVVGLSGAALKTGQLAQSRGAKYVCDRGSSHIRFQYAIVNEEHRRWGIPERECDERMVRREEAEYSAADAITVPSEFARQSFIKIGLPAEKVVKIPYGVLLSRFRPGKPPPTDSFDILFAGTVCLRKGVPYLLQAFQTLEHPRKRLRIAGAIEPESMAVLERLGLDGVEMLGSMSQEKLAEYMSASHVMVLPSIEEGLALVQAQAMACGCPVISSINTGGEDLFQDGVEGFLVPIRSPEAIRERLAQLAADPGLRQRMSAAALLRVQGLGGWADYGEKYTAFLESLTAR